MALTISNRCSSGTVMPPCSITLSIVDCDHGVACSCAHVASCSKAERFAMRLIACACLGICVASDSHAADVCSGEGTA